MKGNPIKVLAKEGGIVVTVNLPKYENRAVTIYVRGPGPSIQAEECLVNGKASHFFAGPFLPGNYRSCAFVSHGLEYRLDFGIKLKTVVSLL